MPPCKHPTLSFVPSRYGTDIGFKRPTSKQLRDAASLTGRAGPETTDPNPSTFPAPLVLPDDELSFEPESTGDDAKTWKNGPWRNAVTSERRTIYLAASPVYAKSMEYVAEWAKPQSKSKSKIPSPLSNDVLEYLRAFYHPLPVEMLSAPVLEFVDWQDAKNDYERIGLNIGRSAIGIRHRPSKDGFFTGQLNLNDLLDAAIAILPKDAYALLMITDHDLYEDEEDDFCCGRAYGGSRVAVVSTARYHPLLDEKHEIERAHAWPASHCKEYMDELCRYEGEEPAPKKAKKSLEPESAMQAAVVAHSALLVLRSAQALSHLWLGRVCKTASHELGHCFGMDHCMFYACIMQGTAGLVEDSRQPPYLCPVDLVKVLYATGAKEVDHYRAMLNFCKKFSEDKLFSAYTAWLIMRLVELEH